MAKMNEKNTRLFICRDLKILNCMMDDHRNKDMEYFGLTGRQFDVIQYLCARRDTLVKQVMIEKDFSLSNPTVSGILDRLEKNGFIQRKASEEDRRCNYIVLTQKAMEAQEQARKKGKSMEQHLFSGITEQEQELFLDILQRLCGNISQMRIEQEKE